MSDALQAMSNVIELKPDKKYLLVFKGITDMQARQAVEMLGRLGIEGIGIALRDGEELEVIEVPEAQA